MLKIFLLRSQFKLTKRETDGLRDVCLFLVKIYVKVWFECPNAISAPFLDLNFIQNVIKYPDSKVSAVILKKYSNHLWYLWDETVALAFFDKNVSFEEKRKMVANLHLQEPVVGLKDGRTYSNLRNFKNYSLSDFVSQKTSNFFNRFELSSAFLELDPATWETAFDYEEGWSFCSDLLVVNDTAERGIKFIQDYNRILTNNEEELQMILQIVEAYKKKYPSYQKSVLLQ